MTHHHRPTLGVGLLLIAALGSACSDSSTTQPEPIVTGPTFDFAFPAQGVSHEFVFTEAGDWAYDCRPHETGGMVGLIRVRESSPRDSALISVGTPPFRVSPDSVTIKLGGTIRWVNTSTAVNHTVSRP